MLTEKQNPNTQHLDQMDTLSMLRLMNEEDQKVALAVQNVLPQIAKAVDIARDKFTIGGRLFYIGAGTSGRLGVLDAVECVPTFGVSHEKVQGIIAGGEGAFVQAVEGAEDDTDAGRETLIERELSADDVLVGVAASGRTPYVLGAVDYAKSIGTPTIGVACNDPSPLLEAVDIPIGVVVGSEILTGSTRLKAGTAQKLVLNMISTAAFAQLGKVYGNLMVDVQVTNEKLAQRAKHIIQEIANVDATRAETLLHASGNNVKVAIVMAVCELDYEEAVKRLSDAGGYLRKVMNASGGGA
ncbi:MAG: N-acetylmuramic acid 6-phosphate etherase [Chloroflexota bacterium]